MQKKFVTTGSFLTSYVEAGTAGKPQLVLVHDGAFGASAEVSWGGVIPLLSERFHIFAPDLLGFGESDKVAFFDRAPYAPRVHQLERFCAELGISDAVFMGVSFGASVLLRWAGEENSTMPARAVVAISGTGGPMRTQEGMAALAQYDPPSRESLRTILGWLVDDFEGFEQQIEQRFKTSMIHGHWETMMAPRLKNPASEFTPPADDFLERLAHVRVPMVFIEGVRDRLLEKGWGRTLAERIPGAKVAVLDCSHEPNIDQPQLLVDTFDEWWQGMTGESR